MSDAVIPILVLILAVSLATAQSPPDLDQIDRLLADGAEKIRTGHTVEAEPVAAEALRLSTASRNEPRIVRSHLLAASAFYHQTLMPEAIEQIELAEPLAVRLNDIQMLKEIKLLKGQALRNQDRLDESLRNFEDWFRLNRSLPKPEPEGSITRMVSILYREIGDTDKSEAMAQEALKLARAAGDQPLVASVLFSLGALAKDRHDYRTAIRLHQEALAMAEKAGDARRQAEILNSMGDAYSSSGEPGQALSSFQRSLDFARQTGYRGVEAQVTERTGQVEALKGRYTQAAEYFERAIAIYGSLGAPPERLWTVHFRWGNAERAAGHPEAAILHYREAIRQIDKLESMVPPIELARAISIAVRREVFDAAAGLLSEIHRSGEALEVADASRAREFLDQLNESKVDLRANLSPSQKLLEDRLSRQIAINRQNPEALGKAIGDLDAFYLDLRRSNPAYSELKRPDLATSERIQQEFTDRNTVFLEYMAGDSRSQAWIVTPAAIHSVVLPGRAQLSALVRPYFEQLSQPVTALTVERRLAAQREQGRRLYNLLLAPIVRYAGSARHLVIVADGILSYLPFETLVGPDGGYLIQNHSISYAQSASASLMMRLLWKDSPDPERRLLALGDPAYGPKSTWPPIPYTRDEVRAVSLLYPNGRAVVRLGAEASESFLKTQELHHYGYLHFAVHGAVDDQRPSRSGLVLSNASDHEDGTLRASEIALLHLNAALVVLSSCRSASGRLLDGEGLLSLSRAFAYAGARNVVASLWNVDDLSTVELMSGLYRQINMGATPQAALRQAKLDLLHGSRRLWRHPHFWSPFIALQ